MRSSSSVLVAAGRVAALVVLGALVGACGGGGGPSRPASGFPLGSINGFTPYCATGEPVSSDYSCLGLSAGGMPNVWSCNRDDATGLMWAKASVAYAGGAGTPPSSLCGLTDWRLPTVRELLSLTQPAKSTAPRIDEINFPGTPAQPFVSSESYLIDSSGATRWAVNFGDGGISTGLGVGATAYVRWVAGSSTSTGSTSGLTRQASGDHFLIDDPSRRLQWLFQTVPQPQTWALALAGAATANAAAHFDRRDWRMPTRNELDTLVDRSRKQPALPVIVTQGVPDLALFSKTFWSSTEWQGDALQAWAVNFESGDIGPYNKTQPAGVVYVRRY